MITTLDLIELLATHVTPVRRLRPPLRRALCWLAFATAFAALLGFYHGLRPDLSSRLQEPSFVAQLGASLLTAATAAIAAFQVSLPDRSRAWLLLPFATLALWVSESGYACLANWVALASDGRMLQESLRCLGTIALISAPLSLSLIIMLRHAGRLSPTATASVGALAVAAVAASVLSLLHEIDATLVVLILHFGTVAVFIAAGGMTGRSLFSLIGAAEL